MLLLEHTLIGKSLASSSVCLCFIHTSKQVYILTPIICMDKSDDTRKVCCSRCCLVMLCDVA